MKEGKVFFHPIEGSGPLTISWSSELKGDALETSTGLGVGFFSSNGELLCVIFDAVTASEDQQFLEFDHYRIEITITNGKATYSLTYK